MSRDISQFLQQAEALIYQLTDEARVEIEATERQASENVSRFFELQEEASKPKLGRSYCGQSWGGCPQNTARPFWTATAHASSS